MDIKTIELKKTILEDNDKDADLLREQLKQTNTFYVNLMSSPGSGKTTTLVSTIKSLQDDGSVGGPDGGLKIGVFVVVFEYSFLQFDCFDVHIFTFLLIC